MPHDVAKDSYGVPFLAKKYNASYSSYLYDAQGKLIDPKTCTTPGKCGWFPGFFSGSGGQLLTRSGSPDDHGLALIFDGDKGAP